jgi:hypothetical protein
MLPFYDGEDGALANAFHLCSRALEGFRLDRSKLANEAKVLDWIRVIEETMNTDGLADPASIGTWRVKARSLTVEEKSAFSTAVDELASWLDMQLWRSAQ